MDQLNKIISLAIGLIFVIFILAVLTGKIDLKSKFPSFFKNTKSTTTNTSITPTPSIKLTKAISYKNNYQNQTSASNNNNLSSIPSTGSPTTTLLFSVSTLLSGIYLRRKNQS